MCELIAVIHLEIVSEGLVSQHAGCISATIDASNLEDNIAFIDGDENEQFFLSASWFVSAKNNWN